MELQRRRRVEQSDSDRDSLDGTSRAAHKASFLEKVQASTEAVRKGDYSRAIRLYTEAIALDPGNHILYGNRSAAYLKVHQLDLALKDARKAREMNPKWAKGHYREGQALQLLGRDAEALSSYATGLAQEPKNMQLLQNMVELAKRSPIKDRFVPLYNQLQKMKLEQSPFVLISVIGQELLSAGAYTACLTVLESALRIGTCSLKLRGSVFSALSTAHWALGNIDKAIACMQQDLAITKSLGDAEGECRAHGNMGAAYFSKGNYREALQHHRSQLVLAMRTKQRVSAAEALSSLGHVYTAVGDYPNALASHKQCVLLVKQGKDKMQEAREIGNVGAVYLAMGDFDHALECHGEHLKVAKQTGNKTEEARAFSNIGSAHHYKREFDKAIAFHNQVLNIALNLNDKTLEARAYAGLGHAARCMQDHSRAKYYHEKQLDNALQTKDKLAESRACSNLGIIYHQLGEYEAALKLHKAHLQLAKTLWDRASQGRAYGNIGNAHNCLGQFDLAIRFHKQELAISKEVCDKHSECSTHGNLAVAYQALGLPEKALYHFNMHLCMAKESKDTSSEARALSNLGNYHSCRKEFSQAIPYFEQCLILSQELHDIESEGKTCHKLGYVHYNLGNYKEAIRYYEQDLALAKQVKNKSGMCRAYCNLGLAHKVLGDLSKALECQKLFLKISHVSKNITGKFSALGNIGDVLMKMSHHDEAIRIYNQQLQLGRHGKDKKHEAITLGNLGIAYRAISQFDKALGYHTQELTLYQELNDARGECKAHGNVGNVHMSLGNYSNAYRCYEEQLDRSRDLKDSGIESCAYGNLGITKINMGQYEDAIGLFEQQLALLQQDSGHQVLRDQGRALGNLGECYEALGDFEEAVKCLEQYLAIGHNLNSIPDQEKAYRGLGNAHRSLGNLQQALVCFEKRLVVAHEMDKPVAKSSAYGELGCLHSLLGNFEQAVSCLQHQLKIAQEMGDKMAEGEAACGLGGVYQQMSEYEKALEFHQIDLTIAQENGNEACQCRAYGNLGLSHESLGNFDQAIAFQEQHLSIAAQMSDRIAKSLAFSSLGRVHHAKGNYPQAVTYLRQGLQIAEGLRRREDEAKIRHRLGLSLWAHEELQEAQDQLFSAVDLFEGMRREAQLNSDYRLSLFDLQTASYQALQRVLVSLGRKEDALVVAERGRTRAFVDFLLERQHAETEQDSWYSTMDSAPVTKEHILEIINQQRAAVMYYSIAAGFLYSWLILPEKGIVKFHECSMAELDVGSDPEDTQSIKSYKSLSSSTVSLLDTYVGQARESLGIESHLNTSRLSLGRSSFIMSETESEADDLWQQHLEELGDRLNAENDRTSFLRMVNRNHIWNCSNYSLGSLLSCASSMNGLAAARSGSVRSKSSVKSSTTGKPPLAALYDLLIAPMEDILSGLCSDGDKGQKDLVIVLQGDIYLVPFALLKPSQLSPCLFERFNVLAVPSIRALQANQMLSKQNRYNPDCSGTLVVGNPKLPQCVIDQWQWNPLPGTEQECKVVSEMMGCKYLNGSDSTKANVMQQIQKAELVHFATHVSWKLAAIVLSPGNFTTTSVHGNLERIELGESTNNVNSSLDGPPLSDFLLTAADILNVKISAKLVVLNSGHTDDRAGRINSDGVVGLTRALLAAGAQCVLFALWPLPEMAARILLKSFYTSLLRGSKTSHALGEAMKTVQNTKQFAHPSNWAAWMLVGSDVRLSSRVALMGHALCELLQEPSVSREAMRVVLHLVEKSLQRIHQGQRNPMYTTQQSIEHKVGDVTGWRDLLISVGFRFEPGSNGLPASVFFPTSDPGDRLTQCSASLQALLGLPVPTLTALCKMLDHQDVGEAVTSLLREVNSKFTLESSVQLPVNVRLWRAPGCHEFLASLGFDLVDVGRDEVTIRAGKQANRRTMQFALQSLVAVFDTQEAPRTLLLDSSSSMESLNSSSSATSTSNLSSPLTSPSSRRRSFFNPAEVDKLPSAAKIHTGTRIGRGSQRGPLPNLSLQLSRQSAIRQKYSSPSASDMSDSNPQDDIPVAMGVDLEEDASRSRKESHVAGSENSHSRHRNSLGSRSSAFGHFPPMLNPYSTSASDSEDAAIPDYILSKAMSHSRCSLVSQSSTLTAKSTGSGFSSRRTRARSSCASNKSWASDRTLTNSTENLLLDVEEFESIISANVAKRKDKLKGKGVDEGDTIHSNSNKRIKSKMKHTEDVDSTESGSGRTTSSSGSKRDKVRGKAAATKPSSNVRSIVNQFQNPSSTYHKKEFSADRRPGKTRDKHCTSALKRRDVDSKSIVPLSSATADNGADTVYKEMPHSAVDEGNSKCVISDPTVVAQKVLAETATQIQALEAMQKLSLHRLQEKWQEKECILQTSKSKEEDEEMFDTVCLNEENRYQKNTMPVSFISGTVSSSVGVKRKPLLANSLNDTHSSLILLNKNTDALQCSEIHTDFKGDDLVSLSTSRAQDFSESVLHNSNFKQGDLTFPESEQSPSTQDMILETGSCKTDSLAPSKHRKGAMKNPTSRVCAITKPKTVKFQDEVELQPIDSSSECFTNNEDDSNSHTCIPYDVKFAEKRIIDKVDTVQDLILNEDASTVTDLIKYRISPILEEHSDCSSNLMQSEEELQFTGHSKLSVLNGLVPTDPLNDTQTLGISNSAFPSSPFSGMQVLSLNPGPPLPGDPPPPYPANTVLPVTYKQPPPYPGPKRRSCDSSSDEQICRSHFDPVPLYKQNGRIPILENSMKASAPSDGFQNPPELMIPGNLDFYSPENLQRASKQFYTASGKSSGKLSGSFRKSLRENISQTVAMHQSDSCSSQSTTNISTSGKTRPHHSAFDGTMNNANSQSEIHREWYHSDTDSVCSHTDELGTESRNMNVPKFGFNSLSGSPQCSDEANNSPSTPVFYRNEVLQSSKC